MTPSEIETVVQELASPDTSSSAHHKLWSALADPKTRPVVRAALSRALDRTPCSLLAFYVTMHALEDDDIDTFSGLANHPDEKVREGAINGTSSTSAIRAETHDAVRPFIVEAMSDVAPKVRTMACFAFGAWGLDKKLALPLERFAALLEDRDSKVRHAATFLVGRLGKSKRLDLTPFLPRLLERLDDDDIYVHEGAAFAIKTAAQRGLDIEACVPALRRHADSPDSIARHVAKGALASLKGRKSRT